MSTAIAKQPTTETSSINIVRPSSIFDDMNRLMERIEKRAFSLFENRGGANGSAFDDWFRAESELVKAAPVEIEEKDRDVIVRAEVPGFEAKELSIQAERDGLSIYGKSEKKKEAEHKGKRYYSEISSSEICRHISLPSNVDPDKVTATLDKGILEIKLPKASAPKLVEVKAA
ncbi:MAG: Hsp20 family protein [Acidobacteriaceae bacterium]